MELNRRVEVVRWHLATPLLFSFVNLNSIVNVMLYVTSLLYLDNMSGHMNNPYGEEQGSTQNPLN